MFKYIILLILFSCGKSGIKSSTNSNDLSSLTDKSSFYVEQIQERKQDSNGFIMTEKCDSLLFTGLLSAARPDLNINVSAAKRDGKWNRRPTHDCGPEFGNSRSTISRDMMIGYFWHLWRAKDLISAVTLMDELKSNAYFLKGDGTPGELFMLPSYMNTLAEMIKAMGGPEYNIELLMPASFQSQPEGFEAHLTGWHIHLRGEILREIPTNNMEILTFLALKNSENPFFQALKAKYDDGNMDKVIDLLLNNNEWPNDSLPTTENHCDEWPIQREYQEKDWGACEPFHEHTGAELVAIYELIVK